MPEKEEATATMQTEFFAQPILNSPYEYPARHWELDSSGQPTQRIVENRRRAEFVTPIPKPRKRKRGGSQGELVLDEGKGLSTEEQQYDPTSLVNSVRGHLDQWRAIPDPGQWRVTPETARLLQHWRHHSFSSFRPFFCQIEAVETAIWLTEVAPSIGATGHTYLDYLARANEQANPELLRLALKLATGAGKTTVMAMLIAWQTINAVRRPGSKRFTRGFLVVTPGITIRDRLRVLQPNDPDSYYRTRELVPNDMLPDLDRAKIVITNFHAFKLRETMDISKGGRALLQGRDGEPVETTETEGQMLQRVMPELMGMKNIMVLNDEAHHCYREKRRSEDELALKGDERKEAEQNNEAARLWISGLEAVQRKLGISKVMDLSATPFFLSGSGYAEGTLFPWTMCDFSLMDAIECGIVKLPRVPIADNIPGDDMPKFRNLWEHIRTKMPKKGRGKAKHLDPLSIPAALQTALDALYGHYEKTFELWEKAGVNVPPCFIVVCNNTSTSKLVCKGGTYPAQLMYQELADMACERITNAITLSHADDRPIKAVLDPYNPTGSTRYVNFNTSKESRWETDARRCHVNWVVLDSDWEAEFCRVAESHPKVKAYVKNHNLGLEVPYRYGSETRTYIPDFIVRVNDGHGDEDLLNLVVEIKGYRGEDAKDKKNTMEAYWIPGVNNHGTYGRWAFAEFTDVYEMQDDFEKQVESEFYKMIAEAVGKRGTANGSASAKEAAT